jgi:hypothetical protein
LPAKPQNEHPPVHAETLQQTPSVQATAAHCIALVQAVPGLRVSVRQYWLFQQVSPDAQ